MIKSKQITVTVPNGVLIEFDSAIKILQSNSKKKITKSGIFTDFIIKFIKKNSND